jgi:malonyl-CoA/methylmalonyl-CoA synthetase
MAPTDDAALLPALSNPPPKEAIRFDNAVLSYAELSAAAAAVATDIATATRVAIWAEPTIETCVGVIGALTAGVPAVPINPKAGERELDHIVEDSTPDPILARPDAKLPPRLTALRRVDLRPNAAADQRTAAPDKPRPDPDAPALIVYTSGTTGPPKGVVIPHRAIASNLDALAEAWTWTEHDILTHGLPLFHVHGLVIGVLGPLRLGGTLHHLGSFSPQSVAKELAGSATMLFGVPTMYHRLADAAERDPAIAQALGQARLLVSGSAALSTADHERIERATGQRVVERYGMTETLMICAVRADGDRRPGTVGRPLRTVELRLIDDDGNTIATGDTDAVGEIVVRGPSLFNGYLGRPDASADAFTDGWFRTGDVATREGDGYIRLIGRRATDLIKSGGFKIGAGEIEAVLLEHESIAEAAVTGEPDPDLGERIVAWIVTTPNQPRPTERELAEHVARLLTPHKRPRVVRYLDALPRNDMGKVMKKALR